MKPALTRVQRPKPSHWHLTFWP